MPRPQKRTLELLAQAAELRAGGQSWPQVGDKVGRDAETVRGWPRRYPADWERLYREAARHSTQLIHAMARAVLHNLLLARDDKTRLAAIDRAVKFKEPPPAADPAAPPSPEDRDLLERLAYVKSLSDDQFRQLVEQSRARARPEPDRTGDGAGAGAAPGPAEPG